MICQDNIFGLNKNTDNYFFSFFFLLLCAINNINSGTCIHGMKSSDCPDCGICPHGLMRCNCEPCNTVTETVRETHVHVVTDDLPAPWVQYMDQDSGQP